MEKNLIIEKLNNMVKNADKDLLKLTNIDFSVITEESILEGLKNDNSKNPKFSYFIHFIIQNKLLTSKVALEIMMKFPDFISTKELHEKLKENEKNKFVDWYIKEIEKGNKKLIPMPKNITLTTEQWIYLLENNIYLENFMTNAYIPKKVRRKFIEQTINSLEVINKNSTISKSEIKYWLSIYETEYFNNKTLQNKELLESLDNFYEVLKDRPELIQYYDNPRFELIKTVLDVNVDNLKYIKNYTNYIKTYAINKNPEIASKYFTEMENKEETCDSLDNMIDDSDYYLAIFDEYLADESNVVKVCVVKKSELKEFLNYSYTVSFGNLYDDTPRYVVDYVNLQPITESELEILKKFGLTNLESGSFLFEK